MVKDSRREILRVKRQFEEAAAFAAAASSLVYAHLLWHVPFQAGSDGYPEAPAGVDPLVDRQRTETAAVGIRN